MSVADEIKLDFTRADRLGFGEAILCAGKTVAQIEEILLQALERDAEFLLTRLTAEVHDLLPEAARRVMDFEPASETAFFNHRRQDLLSGRVAVVSAGSSDTRPAREALRTLEFHGVEATAVFDVGVAGIWRLMERVDEITTHAVVIAVAGMDAALVSVLGGLVRGVIIALPTSVGYGVARGGETAFAASLASCAPGVTVVNIDNGYGAACAALRAARAISDGRS
jgi:NCAIR mutase (PurE)-related protein